MTRASAPEGRGGDAAAPPPVSPRGLGPGSTQDPSPSPEPGLAPGLEQELGQGLGPGPAAGWAAWAAAAASGARHGRLGVTTSGLRGARRIRRILALLGWRVTAARPWRRVEAIAGWGDKPTAAGARAEAARRDVPYLTLEDGFLRSRGLGLAGAEPLSLIVDRRGSYLDIRARSELEALLLDDGLSTAAVTARARAALDRVTALKVTKYNQAPSAPAGALPERYALVIDQTFGDASIAGAAADARSFEAMLRAALSEADGLPVLVKTHPDVLAGLRRSYLAPSGDPRESGGARFLTDDLNPWDVIASAARVYAVSSQMGYEAALAGKPVHLFGWPFYAGWGLTTDRVPPPFPLRRRRLDAARMFAASHLIYPVYYDPDADALTRAETVVDRLSRSS